MRLITRESDYGIAALVWMAGEPGNPFSATELARKLGIPGSFLRRILQRLGRHGLVRSRKGLGGGFVLAAAPETITVGDIAAALQGPVRLSDCEDRKSICPRHKHCALRRELKNIEGRLNSDLTGISIASLAG